MKKTLPLVLLALMPVSAQQAAVTMAEFSQSWKNTRAYTLAVADAMPAEFYGFKPAPPEMTFARQMIHLAEANYSWFTIVMGEKETLPQPTSEDKATVMKYLRDTFDYCIAALDRITPAELDRRVAHPGGREAGGSGRDALLNMYMHVAHHRAQAIVYLRLKGITPPEYVY